MRSACVAWRVTVCATPNNPSRFTTLAQSEEIPVQPHIADPFPNIAAHVLTSVRTAPFGKTSARKFPVQAGSGERQFAQRRVHSEIAAVRVNVAIAFFEFITPGIHQALS